MHQGGCCLQEVQQHQQPMLGMRERQTAGWRTLRVILITTITLSEDWYEAKNTVITRIMLQVLNAIVRQYMRLPAGAMFMNKLRI